MRIAIDASTDAIAYGVRRLLGDEALRATLRDRGLERAKRFPWSRTARDTLEVYREVGVWPPVMGTSSLSVFSCSSSSSSSSSILWASSPSGFDDEDDDDNDDDSRGRRAPGLGAILERPAALEPTRKGGYDRRRVSPYRRRPFAGDAMRLCQEVRQCGGNWLSG